MSNIDVKGMIERIEKRLAELGMSKDEFYESSGISSASFSQWNTGRHFPTPKKLSSAAKALQVSAEYLLTGEGKETPPTDAGAMSPERKDVHDMIDQMTEAEVNLMRERARKIIDSR